MEFGKIEHLVDVDFRLPADHPQTSISLDKKHGTSRIFLGTTEWGCKAWMGKMYPPKTPANRFLGEYVKHFGTVELNSTFYGTPKKDTILRWKDAAGEGFFFCPKISQSISHYRRLANCKQLTEEFCDSMALFGESLGTMFLQMPPDFGPARFSVLEDYLTHFPQGSSLALELRHPDWFANHKVADQLFSLLEGTRTAFVITDVAGRRDLAYMRLPVPLVFVRFIGNDRHPTDFVRLDAWSERLAQWTHLGSLDIFFFIHQPDAVVAPETTIYFSDKLHTHGMNTRCPRLIQSLF